MIVPLIKIHEFEFYSHNIWKSLARIKVQHILSQTRVLVHCLFWILSTSLKATLFLSVRTPFPFVVLCCKLWNAKWDGSKMNGCYCAEQVMLHPCVESFDTEIHHPFGIYVSDPIITRIYPFYFNLIPIPSLGHIFFSSVSV